ncbi:hypothetical protein D1AOALGA4SA_3559 [Olavius algarvensis Delta 1 endosymbiont]|nr:hypothetical protein D1AOALGA4SA_3559 [Olavius algarvensis Delta 1 endosymbiont]
MKLTNRLRDVGIAFVLCLISAPIAIAVTIALLPFWSWMESMSEIESVGHSGPAAWCYLMSYIIILSSIFLIWWAIRRRANI